MKQPKPKISKNNTFKPCPKSKPKEKVKYSLKRVSIKRAKQEMEYLKVRREYLELHPACEYLFNGCTYMAVEIDHTKGRIGELLTNKDFFKATCRNCHNIRHDKNL